MGHTNFIVRLEIMEVQDPKSSWRFPTSSLSISSKTKVALNQIGTHTNILEKIKNVAHINFQLEIWSR